MTYMLLTNESQWFNSCFVYFNSFVFYEIIIVYKIKIK